MIAKHIGDNNLFVRLHGNAKQFFRYGYDYVDLTADADTIEDTIAKFVKDICNDILKILEAKLARLAESSQSNKDEIERFQLKKDEYSSYYNKIGTERGVYKKMLSAVEPQNMQITLKDIPTIYYRRQTMRYGIEISVNDTKALMYIGDKTQTILYIAALIRFKMGRPLYLHELYRNSHGSRSIYKREKTYKWLELIFDEIFGKTEMFEDWANPIRTIPTDSEEVKSKRQPRPGHDFNQAKSGILKKLKAALGTDLAFAVERYCLNVATDDNKYSYYTFNCSPNEIVLDEKAQKLSKSFEKIYNLAIE
jgi:hypothetical protein